MCLLIFQELNRFSRVALVLLLASMAFVTPAYSDKFNQEESIAFLTSCQDNRDCRRTIRRNKRVIPDPSLSIQQRVCTDRLHFIRAAKRFNVRPETLAACMFAEHAFLYNRYDRDMDRDPKPHVHDDPSLGPLQIKLSTAALFYSIVHPDIEVTEDQHVDLDEHASSVDEVDAEDSRPTTEELMKLVNEVMVMESATLYGAAILKEAVDAYKTIGGFEIYDKTDIQCTLYQLGNPQRRARATRSVEGKEPQPNFYGIYAKWYEPMAKDLLEANCASYFTP